MCLKKIFKTIERLWVPNKYWKFVHMFLAYTKITIPICAEAWLSAVIRR